MLINGVVNYEKSPCGDCKLLKMCRLVYEIEGIRDLFIDFRIIVEKCEAYEKGDSSSEISQETYNS